MKRTSLVLAALACATLGLAAQPALADPHHPDHPDHRAPYGRVSQRDVDAALYRFRQAESNHAAARRFLDDSVGVRHRVAADIGRLEQEIAAAIAANERYHAVERLRRDLATAEARFADTERQLRDAQRRIEDAQHGVRAADDAFMANARRDPAYRAAADRAAAAQRELDSIASGILRQLESTYEWRALVGERDEAIERLERVRGNRYISGEHIRSAEQAVADAEYRLGRLRERALSEDPNYGRAQFEMNSAQSEMSRVLDDLRRYLHQDAGYRRAVDRLAAAEAELEQWQRRAGMARGEVDAVARELDRWGDVYISYVDVNAIERDRARLEQKLCEVDVQIDRARHGVAAADREVFDARRQYQQVLAEYNRACEEERRYGDRNDRGRIRDRDDDRGNRYRRP